MPFINFTKSKNVFKSRITNNIFLPLLASIHHTDKMKKNIHTCVYRAKYRLSSRCVFKLFYRSLPMHENPTPFVAQRKKKKRKTAIHTRLHTCCERIAWKNGGKGRAEVRKVFDIPFNPVGPINRDSADTCHVPPGYPPRQGTNHGVETRFVTRWLGWIVAFENFIRQRWPIVPRALPKLSFM